MIEDINENEETTVAEATELKSDIGGLIGLEDNETPEEEEDESSKESVGGGVEEDKEEEGKVSKTEDDETGKQESKEAASKDDEKNEDSGDLGKDKEKEKEPELTEADKLRARLLEFETISTEVLPKEETVKEEVKVSEEEVKKEEPKELFTDDEYVAAMESKDGMETLIQKVLGRAQTPQQAQINIDEVVEAKVANVIAVDNFYRENKDLNTPQIKKYVSKISGELMGKKEYNSLDELLKDTEKTVRDNLYMPKVSTSTNNNDNGKDKKQSPSFAMDKKTNPGRNKQGKKISEEQQDMLDIINV